MGGLGPVGTLFKRSYYLYTVGLVLYVAVVYGPTLLSGIVPTTYPEPAPVLWVLFSVLWLLGVVSVAHSMYRVHRVMAAKKAAKISEIEAEIYGQLDEPFDIAADHIEDPETRASIQHRLDQVRATREYPSTFAMWTQLAVSVLLPQVLQLTTQWAL
jgi:hypothetical protein